MKDLGIIPGTPGNSGSGATAIDDAGTIVGYAKVDTTMATRIPSTGIPMARFTISEACPAAILTAAALPMASITATRSSGRRIMPAVEQVGMIYERAKWSI